MFGLNAPAFGRCSAWIACGVLAGVLSAGNAEAQAGGQAPAGQAEKAATVTTEFGPDAGFTLFFVKPDKVSDFESVMTKLKEALQKSEKPERKQQAAGWKLFKSSDAPQAGAPGVVYIFVVDPAVKGADYTVGNILFEAFPKEAATIYKQFADSLAQGLSQVKLAIVQEFGK
jgi:hypothetical protein